MEDVALESCENKEGIAMASGQDFNPLVPGSCSKV